MKKDKEQKNKNTREILEKSPQKPKDRVQNKNLIPGANKDGRPKGALNYKTRVDIAVGVLAQKYVDDYNSKHRRKKIKLEDVDIYGDIFQQAVNKARNGDMKAITDLFDRLYGKPTQAVEFSGPDSSPITYAMKMAKVDAETDEWFKTWVKGKEDLDNKKQDDKTPRSKN